MNKKLFKTLKIGSLSFKLFYNVSKNVFSLSKKNNNEHYVNSLQNMF